MWTKTVKYSADTKGNQVQNSGEWEIWGSIGRQSEKKTNRKKKKKRMKTPSRTEKPPL